MATLRGAVSRLTASMDVLRGIQRSPFASIAEAYYPQQPSCQISALWFLYDFYLGRRAHGTFIEVGAYDGVFVSNSWGLAARGWSGYMIEPIPLHADRCRRNHAMHPNVRVVETAVGAADDQTLTLHLAGTLTTASTATYDEYATVDWAQHAQTSETISVPSRRLDTILTELGVKPGFEVLIVDVEGFETEVYAGFDVARWMPAMQIVELADIHPDLNATRDDYARLAQVITSRDYVVAYKDVINTVFVRGDIWRDAHSLSNTK